MIDLHLINMALAGLGIGEGAITLIAVAIIALAATRTHRAALRRTVTPAIPATSGRQATTSPVGISLGKRAA